MMKFNLNNDMICKWVWRITVCFSLVKLSIGQDEPEEIAELPKLYKCCQDNEYFDLLSLSCASADGIQLDKYKINPGFEDYENEPEYFESEPDVYYSTETQKQPEETLDSENSDPDASVESFQILSQQLPYCPSETHELKYALHIDGKRDDSFSVFPFNDTASVLTIADESLLYFQEQFCVERGFRRRYSNINDQKFNDFRIFGDNLKQGTIFEGTAVVYCWPKEEVDCKTRPCVNSCCHYLDVIDDKRDTCRSSLNKESPYAWKGELYDPTTKKLATKEELAEKYRNISDGRPLRVFYNRQGDLNCSTQLYTLGDDARILLDGSAVAGGNNFYYNQFCVQSEEVHVKGNEFKYSDQLRVCVPEDVDNFGLALYNKVVNFLVIPILSVISAVCLCFLFVFLWIKDRSKLFASMILCTIATLAAFYIFLSIIKLGGKELVQNYKVSCIVLGFLTQFTNLSSFFWLNSLSIDIWLKFRKLEAPKRNMTIFKKQVNLGCAVPRFKGYALYSWGIPIFIVLFTVLVQYLPPVLQNKLTPPGVGKHQCFLEAPYAILWYLFIISAPVLFSNLVLFILFVYNMVYGIWSKSSSMVTRQKYRSNLIVVTKIFFVMGLTWLADIISFFVAWTFGTVKTYKYIAFFDFINALQGVAIMVVMVFDAETLKKIKTKIDHVFGVEPAVARKGTSSSSGLSMTVFDAQPTRNTEGCEQTP